MPITIEGGKTYDSVKEMFEDIDREFKEEHPIEYWIDNSLFKGKGLFSYAPHHVIEHPWILVKDVSRQIKWAWQRVFRGWDDRIIWSIDFYLDEKIPVWMEQLKKQKHGVPSCLFESEDWDELNGVSDEKYAIAEAKFDSILDQIAEGFKAHREMEEFHQNEPEYKELEKKFDNAFSLLHTHWSSLWD